MAPTHWRDRLATVLEHDVVPAFGAYRSALVERRTPDRTPRTTRPGSSTSLTVSCATQRSMRAHTTTDRTPEDLHETGLAVVARIHEEFAALGADALRYSRTCRRSSRVCSPTRRCAGARRRRSSTPRRPPCDAPRPCPGTGSAGCPLAVCTLEPIPELEADSSGTAYYMPPSLDGSRPGTYYTNVSKPTERTSFDLESVAFHEAVPGHHFQLSLALELPDLPMIRRLTLFNAVRGGLGPVLGTACRRDGPVLVDRFSGSACCRLTCGGHPGSSSTPGCMRSAGRASAPSTTCWRTLRRRRSTSCRRSTATSPTPGRRCRT